MWLQTQKGNLINLDKIEDLFVREYVRDDGVGDWRIYADLHVVASRMRQAQALDLHTGICIAMLDTHRKGDNIIAWPEVSRDTTEVE